MANLNGKKYTGKYYIGLDCGTSSVGWAVSDPEYHLLRAKGKTLWGSRLFDEANTAAERRTYRSARRRLDRANNRLKLLRLLFRDEITKVDPSFYLRLDESFYRAEDKNQDLTSTDTLFSDPNLTDKDFHKKYPTIWHLRQAIIESKSNDHFDIREYFLAIQYIFKHRGHFLIDGKLQGNAGNFPEFYEAFAEAAEAAGFFVRDDHITGVEQLLRDKTKHKTEKKAALKELLKDEDAIISHAAEDDSLNEKSNLKLYGDLAGLIIGSSVQLTKLFQIESEEKLSFTFEKDFDEQLANIEQNLTSEQLDLLFAAKKIYDYAVLKNLLGDSASVSAAMIRNYDLHEQDLSLAKGLLRPYPDDYAQFFKAHDRETNYVAYIGQAYTISGGRHKSIPIPTQKDLNKELGKLLEKHQIAQAEVDAALIKSQKPNPQKVNRAITDSDFSAVAFLQRLEDGALFPKQRGQAKGTIPQQLHHYELELILAKLEQDYPSFAKKDDLSKLKNASEARIKEAEKYNTKSKKLARIHSFRRPYFCGPLPKRNLDANGNRISNSGSDFSWADEEISEIVYPWNFNSLVDLDQRAENFINRMTNECTYLVGEDVLPKASPLYQKYMVLNEINNLKINGQRPIDHETKIKIYELFGGNDHDAILSGNVTLRSLEKELKKQQIIAATDELSGTAEQKYLPKLSTHKDLIRCLGPDYTKKYTSRQIEDTIRAITILNNDQQMLKSKLAKILKITTAKDKDGNPTTPENDPRVINLSKLKYKDWGNFSEKLLVRVTSRVGVREMNILEALEETESNLMELLGENREYHFREAIDEYNETRRPTAIEITYEDVKNLYCSPAVKRGVWQAVKIVKELEQVIGRPPERIFLESTREKNDPKKGATLARRKQLEELYRSSNSTEAKELLKELGSKEDRDLQNKKLYLYFCQMGRCAYSGERIDIDELMTRAYDIDHIYPRSLTKDDSITRNLVLVKAELNREKTNTYPIAESIRAKCSPMWRQWALAGLITKEKYNRLTRSTHLTDEELAGFISRQIVETSQTVKAIRGLFNRAYPNSKVILVKAGQVSNLRHLYGYDKINPENNTIIRPGRPEFIKVRALNDFHHAKDAYLNIVVGDTMSRTFTNDPYNWIKKRNEGDNHKYSIKPELLFRENKEYILKKVDPNTGRLLFEEKRHWPEMSGWNYGESLKIVSDTLKRNDVLWTRMPIIKSGALSKQTILGKAKDNSALMPLRSSGRLSDVNTYGGYDKVAGAYFSVIEEPTTKGAVRRIIQIPIKDVENSESFIARKYPGAEIVIPKILFKAKIQYDKQAYLLAAKTGDRLVFHPAMQVHITNDLFGYLKKVLNVYSKNSVLSSKGKTYTIEERDGVSKEKNHALISELFGKNKKLYQDAPRYKKRLEISNSIDKFDNLDLLDQCRVIIGISKLLACNAESGDKDLTPLVTKTAGLSQLATASIITGHEIYLVDQSVTGLFERKINLNTIPPQPNRGQKKSANPEGAQSQTGRNTKGNH